MTGWGLVALVYVAVLAWAGSLNAGADEVAHAAAAQPVAGAITVAAEEVAEEAVAVAAVETPAEAPLVTLGIAAGMVALAGGAYAIHAFRARKPRRAASVRLVVRHITTLH